MKVIGIDPGSVRTGWGIIETLDSTKSVGLVARSGAEFHCIDYGTIELDPKTPVEVRLARLYEHLEQILLDYKVDALVAEKVFLSKNFDSAFKLGQVRGVVLALAGKYRLDFFEYATRKIKKMLTGNGDAAKEQVQLMVSQFVSKQINGLDASDAMALAIGHAMSVEVTNKLQSQNKNLEI